MNAARLWGCLALAGSLQFAFGSPEPGPLFLTPFIERNDTETAKNESKVELFTQFGIMENAYSGYITVNQTTQSHLFFLFIEAKENSSKAPLMLWTQGGPGLSALFGLFLQNGPVKIEAQYYGDKVLPKPSKRELTIQNDMNVIYLDAPIGAGFSFSNKSAYPTSMENVTTDILEFLKQFLKLFPQYVDRDFYAAGDSYAARYSVALAYQMLLCPSGDLKLNMQGIIGGVGFLAPVLYLADSSDFLLQASMLDTKGYATFKLQFEKMWNLTATGNYSYFPLVLDMLFNTIFTSDYGTYFQNLTLYNAQGSPLYTERPLPMLVCFGYLNDSSIKKALHAGENANLQYSNPNLLKSFAGDWLVDITPLIEYVLTETRVLFYSGQLDALFPSAKLQAYFDMLNWTHADLYRKANRTLWRPPNSYNGAAYLKSAGKFFSAVVLGMSHYAGFDKPDETYYLMTQFINQKISFSPQKVSEN